MDDLKKIIKQRLSDTFHGDTQADISRKLNVTQGNVSKWLAGSQIPTSDMFFEIAKAYKVSVDWLLGLSDYQEIDGIALEKLTYEQVATIIDKLIEIGTITIPDLEELRGQLPVYEEFNTGGVSEEYENENGVESETEISRRPTYDPDYMKVNDRVLSYMLRRRQSIYAIGDDFKETWKEKSLPNYRDVRLLNYSGNMQEAIDIHSWASYKSDADWIELIKKLEAMTEEERTTLIEKTRKKEGAKK